MSDEVQTKRYDEALTKLRRGVDHMRISVDQLLPFIGDHPPVGTSIAEALTFFGGTPTPRFHLWAAWSGTMGAVAQLTEYIDGLDPPPTGGRPSTSGANP